MKPILIAALLACAGTAAAAQPYRAYPTHRTLHPDEVRDYERDQLDRRHEMERDALRMRQKAERRALGLDD